MGTVGAPRAEAAGTSASDPTSLAAKVVAEQIELVSRSYQGPVTGAGDALAGDQAALTADQAALVAGEAMASATAAAQVSATATLAADTRAHLRAVVGHDRASALLALDRRRLRAIAVTLYMGPPGNGTAESAGSVEGAQSRQAAEESLVLAEGEVGGSVRTDVVRAAVTGRRQDALAQEVAGATTTVALDIRAAASAAAAIPTEQAAVASVSQSAASDQVRLSAAQQVQAAAVAAINPAPVAGGSLTGAPQAVGPTILGPSVLDAAQLNGWFAQSGNQVATIPSAQALIGWYLSDGSIEGVRGDLAFAQAVLETGGFSSPDSVTLNNYAGIGHCDTCTAGLAFVDPETGVIGQLQLLRTFADAGTASGLPQPLALASLDPSQQHRRGCCSTWDSLTGVWATDPDYGDKILSLYSQMLEYALSTQPVLGQH